jgi:hypothetical protein
MSALKTYDRPIALTGQCMPWPFDVVGGCGDPKCDPITPGCWVSKQVGGGLGFVVAVNDDNLSILWSEEPNETGGFTNIAFPIVRRVFPQSLRRNLVSVQPMSVPAGSVFYMDYKYNDPLAARCNTGPWWGKLFWRAWRCTSTRTHSLLSLLQSWWRSLSTRKPTSTGPGELLDVQRELLIECIKEPDRARKLADKWSAVTRSSNTPGPSEEP